MFTFERERERKGEGERANTQWGGRGREREGDREFQAGSVLFSSTEPNRGLKHRTREIITWVEIKSGTLTYWLASLFLFLVFFFFWVTSWVCLVFSTLSFWILIQEELIITKGIKGFLLHEYFWNWLELHSRVILGYTFGEHSITYREIESLCCIPETIVTLSTMLKLKRWKKNQHLASY